jgi:hypothetical protein
LGAGREKAKKVEQRRGKKVSKKKEREKILKALVRKRKREARKKREILFLLN